jgi:hypothetical protein
MYVGTNQLQAKTEHAATKDHALGSKFLSHCMGDEVTI